MDSRRDEIDRLRRRLGSLGPIQVNLAIVKSSFPALNCYIIEYMDGDGRYAAPAVYAGAMGNQGPGAREYGGLVTGTLVAVLRIHRGVDIIICPVASVNLDSTTFPSSFLQQGGGSHLFTDPMRLIGIQRASSLVKASNGGPLDIQGGEWATINEMGQGIAVERFAAWLRADDMCGIWAYWHNRTLRIAHRDLIQHGYGRDDYEGFADGELNRTHRMAAYADEAVGLRTGVDAQQLPGFVNKTGRPIKKDQQHGRQAAYEPVDANLVLAPRLLELTGHNADVYQRYVVIPSPDKSQFVREDPERYFGVMREVLRADGSYLLETRSTLSLRKTISIPAPVDVQDLRSPGKTINRVELNDFDWFGEREGSSTADIAALAEDYHSFVMNLHTYQRLTGRSDWSVPEADADFQKVTKTIRQPGSKSRFWDPLPEAVEVEIAPGQTRRYYRSQAGLDIQPDGTVVLSGPSGEQMIMGGGSILFSAPKGIYNMPGQTFAVWAPADAIIRAGQDVDISSTSGNVRTKAERNLLFLGGNGGSGGILFENKGAAAANPGIGNDIVVGGIVFKSAGTLSVQADQFQASVSDFNVQATGTFTLEAANYIATLSTFWTVRTGEATHYLSDSAAFIDSDTVIFYGNALIEKSLGVGDYVRIEGAAGLRVEGQLYVDGVIAATESIVSRRNVIGESVGPDPDIGEKFQVEEDNANNDNDGVREPVSELAKTIQQQQEEFSDQLDPIYLSVSEVWTDFGDNLSALGFSFRRDGEYRYGHDGFILPEFSWQRRLRIIGSASTWEEAEVAAPAGLDAGEPTMPHPGRATWLGTLAVDDEADKPGILQATSPYYDPQTELPTTRSSEGAVTIEKVPLASFKTNT